MILIDKDAPGFSCGRKEVFMGMRGMSNGELIYDNCRVPSTCMFGPENGWSGIAAKFTGYGLIGVAAISAGLSQAAVDTAVAHAKTREIAGKLIGQQQGVQYLIAANAGTIVIDAGRKERREHGFSRSWRPPLRPTFIDCDRTHGVVSTKAHLPQPAACKT